MRFPAPGQFRTLEAFRERLGELGLDFGLASVPSPPGPLAQPQVLFGRTLTNRFCAQPMEGWDGTSTGGPGPHTLRRWRNFGRSGASLVWGGEAFAVSPDGRANPNQLCLHEDSERGLAQLLGELRAGRAEVGGDPAAMLVGLQLTHSGRFARPDGPPQPRLAHWHPLLGRKYGLDPATPLLTDGELEAIGERMLDAAILAQRVGFDFVDVKCCHGYLLHELLGAHTRPGPYGGDLQGRSRLLLRIVDGIASACPGLGIGVRLSAGDLLPHQPDAATRIGEPMPHGDLEPWRFHFGMSRSDPLQFDLVEPIALLRTLQQRGVPVINVTLGSPYWNPHLQRPAAYPPSDGYLPPQDPLRMVALHLDTVRALKRACPELLLVGTGYTYLQEHLPSVAMAQLALGHVDFVGIGRLLLSYPELPADVLAGKPPDRKRWCRTFSDCTTAPRNGLPSGCFPLDPYYKAMPEAQRVKAIRQELDR